MPPEVIATNATDSVGVGDLDLLVALRSAQDEVGAVFQVLVNAVARPGSIHQMSSIPAGVVPAAIPVLVVADLRTPLAVVGPDSEALAAALGRVSGASIAGDLGSARIVLVSASGSLTTDVIWALRTGSAHQPELGATVFVSCDRLVQATSDTAGAFRTSGPGASDGRWLVADGIDLSAIRELDGVNSGYPSGVDLFLVARNGSVVALPRSNRLLVTGEV